jgi:hypothetical protein
LAKLNLKFVVRGVLIGVPAACLLFLIGLTILLPQTPLGSPPAPTPLVPTIAVPRGEMPSGPVGLAEYAQYRGNEYVRVGSGFVLVLESGDLVGVTTAHSVALGDPDRPPERIALRVPGQPGDVAEFDALYGAPGRPMDGPDLSIDYVLLLVSGPVDPALVLAPDPRGGPQPGERVSLLSGTGGGQGGRYELSGTVQSVDEGAAWVLMDKESFNPGMMSGSPFISQHTGQVVGMAIAASPRHLRLIPPRYRVMLGMHPIGSIVEKAEAADSFPAISTYEGRSNH